MGFYALSWIGLAAGLTVTCETYEVVAVDVEEGEDYGFGVCLDAAGTELAYVTKGYLDAAPGAKVELELEPMGMTTGVSPPFAGQRQYGLRSSTVQQQPAGNATPPRRSSERIVHTSIT